MYAMALPRNPTNLDILLEVRDVKRDTNQLRDDIFEVRQSTKENSDKIYALEIEQARRGSNGTTKKKPQDITIKIITGLLMALSIIAALVNFVVGGGSGS